ncbi:MAG: hypothetical protein PHT95_01115 [Candidatus Omnitrophica bacterium]|nr:hypothetical protein [Candidatus Omnitrophota bacterium]
MKRHIMLTLLMVVSVLSDAYCITPGDGPFRPVTLSTTGGEVNSLSVSGDGYGAAIFATTDEGIYTLSGGQKYWRIPSPGDLTGKVLRIAIRGERFYAATPEGVYMGKQNEAGGGEGFTRWERIWANSSGVMGVDIIGDDRSGDPVVWTINKVYILSPMGERIIGEQGSWNRIEDLAVSGGDIYVLADGAVFVHGAGTSLWKKISLGLGAADPEEDAASEDEMEESDESIEEIPGSRGTIRARGDGSVLAATTGGLYKISVGGERVSSIDAAGLHGRVRIAIISNGGVFAATDKEVFYLDHGRPPIRIFSSISGGRVNDILIREGADGEEIVLVACGKNVSVCDLSEGDLFEMPRKVKGMMLAENVPDIKEVHRMAIEYAEVSPEKIERWREAARWKALMPKLSFSFSEDKDDNIELYTSATSRYHYVGPQTTDKGWSAGLSWDLSDVVWNSAQTSIDVRSKLMVQLRNDVLQEVTRLYFERKRLLAGTPEPCADKGRGKAKEEGLAGSDEERLIRVDEITAQIDALTGGRFSSSMSVIAED